MKKVIIFELGIILSFLFALTNCNEKQADLITTNSEIENINQVISANNLKSVSANEDEAVFLGLAAHRAIHTRPRDGKICYCDHCFGICQVHPIGCDWTIRSILVPNSNNSSGVLYIIDNLDYAESEFGVDDNYDIPSSSLSGTKYETITILRDVYDYQFEEDTITVGNNSFLSFGKVTIDLTITLN
jgi:hypothetical protein